MNNLSISLSSNQPDYQEILDEIILNDLTNFQISLSGLSESTLPYFLTIDWGDGDITVDENDVFGPNDIPNNRISSMFFKEYSHVYKPSINSTSKTLSAAITVKYINGDESNFTIPLEMVNFDYETSIKDFKLISSSSNGNKNTHRLLSETSGYIVEIETRD